MKEEIKYNADSILVEVIRNWQNWLRDERLYSEHTVDAYSRDLSDFLAFFKEKVSLGQLSELDIIDFRKYISSKKTQLLNKSSLARKLSTIRNFYRWLSKKKLAKNSAISILSSPKHCKISKQY